MGSDAHFSSLTDVGRVRDHNEDTTAVVNPTDPEDLALKGVLGLVADGMGGHEAGEVASSKAADAFIRAYFSKSELDPGRAMQIAAKAANDAVRSIQAVRAGTTLVAAAVIGDEAHLVNVGDSRAYLVTPDAIRQITRDHSWVQEQVNAGHLTKEQARQHPRRNVLTRCLGGDAYIQADYYHEMMCEGCSIVLCSDGLHGMVSDQDLAEVVRRAAPDRAALDLIALANKHGGHDNISVVILRNGGVEGLETGFKTVRAENTRSRTLLWVLGAFLLVGMILGLGVAVPRLLSGIGTAGGSVAGAEASATPPPTTIATQAPVAKPPTPIEGEIAPVGGTPVAIAMLGSEPQVIRKGTEGLSITDANGSQPKPLKGSNQVRDVQAADADSAFVLTDQALFRVRRTGPLESYGDPNGRIGKERPASVARWLPNRPYPLALASQTGLLICTGPDARDGDTVAPSPGNRWNRNTDATTFKWIFADGVRSVVTLGDAGPSVGTAATLATLDLLDIQRIYDTSGVPIPGKWPPQSRLTTKTDLQSFAVWSPGSPGSLRVYRIGDRGSEQVQTRDLPTGTLVWVTGTQNGYEVLMVAADGRYFHAPITVP